jgi:hypothetical protein
MKLLKYLFTTDIYDDIEIMPNKNKIIINISSLWILNLVSHSYNNNLNFLTLHLILISIISPLFQYNKYILISCFIYLWFNMNYLIFIKNLFFIIPPFILTSIANVDNNYTLQLYSHQIYLFFIFKLFYDYINISYNYFLIISTEYILYTLYLISINDYNTCNTCNTYKYSLEIISIIGINEYCFYNIKNDNYL